MGEIRSLFIRIILFITGIGAITSITFSFHELLTEKVTIDILNGMGGLLAFGAAIAFFPAVIGFLLIDFFKSRGFLRNIRMLKTIGIAAFLGAITINFASVLPCGAPLYRAPLDGWVLFLPPYVGAVVLFTYLSRRY